MKIYLCFTGKKFITKHIIYKNKTRKDKSILYMKQTKILKHITFHRKDFLKHLDIELKKFEG